MYPSIRKNTFTLVTLQSFSITGAKSAEKKQVENWEIYRHIPPVIQTSVNFSIFNLHFLSWYYTWNAETLQGY